MKERHLRVLVVAADDEWRKKCVLAMYGDGCEADVFSSGLQAIASAHKRFYDIIVVDDSLQDMGLIEFILDLLDVEAGTPLLLIAGKNVSLYQHVWEQCKVSFAGYRHDVFPALCEAVKRLQSPQGATDGARSLRL